MEDYDLYLNEAQRIVELVLNQSVTYIQQTIDEENVDTSRRVTSEDEFWKNRRFPTVNWPTIGEMTDEKVGLNKIIEYIEQDWKKAPGAPDACWLYAVDFIEKKSFEFTDLYVYRARFSIPTRRQPIPRFTVSIYFTLDVSKVRPKTHPIDVSFVVETMRLVHKPLNFRFRQNWLENVILLKENLASGIDF